MTTESQSPERSSVAETTARFGGLEIGYAASVLPPRHWTAAQSRWAAQLGRGAQRGPILELCTGAGHIGLLAAVLSGRALVAVDVNPTAVECARENAVKAGIGHRVKIRCSPIESALADTETYPLIIADPPWVRHDEIGRYPADPPLAIDGGADGLRLTRVCLDVIHRHLKPGGTAVLQLGSPDQIEALRPDLAARRLLLTEQRTFPGRGVLVRLDAGSSR